MLRVLKGEEEEDLMKHFKSPRRYKYFILPPSGLYNMTAANIGQRVFTPLKYFHLPPMQSWFNTLCLYVTGNLRTQGLSVVLFKLKLD